MVLRETTVEGRAVPIALPFEVRLWRCGLGGKERERVSERRSAGASERVFAVAAVLALRGRATQPARVVASPAAHGSVFLHLCIRNPLSAYPFRVRIRLPTQEHPEVRWEEFSLPITLRDVPRLHEIIAALVRNALLMRCCCAALGCGRCAAMR